MEKMTKRKDPKEQKEAWDGQRIEAAFEKKEEVSPVVLRECPHDKTPLLQDQLNCPACGSRVTGEVIAKGA